MSEFEMLDAPVSHQLAQDLLLIGVAREAQLLEIAVESGYTERGGYPSTLKKSELVTAFVTHFTWAHQPDNTTDTARTAREWLPGAMRFPAIDPLAQDQAREEAIGEETSGEAMADEALAA